jgi:hypothetical protein
MRKGFLIYEYLSNMRKPLVQYDFAPAILQISLYLLNSVGGGGPTSLGLRNNDYTLFVACPVKSI